MQLKWRIDQKIIWKENPIEIEKTNLLRSALEIIIEIYLTMTVMEFLKIKTGFII